jgi:ABC-type cobalamin transport system permease subunit
MLSQQVQFNGAVVRALLQLYTNYWDDDALLMLLAERCGTMATHIADLEARLAQAEEQEESSRGNAHE